MSKRETIHDLLIEAFAPAALEVIDESGNHSVPEGSESHFKVVVVSAAFDGKALVGRHRAINAALDSLLGPKLIHALAIHAYTPAEWSARGHSFPASPPCLGGSKHERRP
jgi:stress-induced morphogen